MGGGAQPGLRVRKDKGGTLGLGVGVRLSVCEGVKELLRERQGSLADAGSAIALCTPPFCRFLPVTVSG
jgi:hypothetical protein